jgi:L,D-transpeptidase catalytic domain
MRWFIIPAAAIIVAANSPAAKAAVNIEVNKDLQQMTISVDGQVRYRWPVSTGNPSHETPNGTFRTFRMEEDHFSKEFDDAPMPHSIFFTREGHAMHGTDSVKTLGLPVSHGCVRLSRANATTLWNLVKQEGLLKTTVTLTGSSQVALARARSNVASRGNSLLDADASVAPGQPLNTVPPGATYDRPGDDGYYTPQYQTRQPQQSYYGSGYGNRGVVSAPDPRNPNRRIYVDPRYSQSYNDGYYMQYDRYPSEYYQRGY